MSAVHERGPASIEANLTGSLVRVRLRASEDPSADDVVLAGEPLAATEAPDDPVPGNVLEVGA